MNNEINTPKEPLLTQIKKELKETKQYIKENPKQTTIEFITNIIKTFIIYIIILYLITRPIEYTTTSNITYKIESLKELSNYCQTPCMNQELSTIGNYTYYGLNKQCFDQCTNGKLKYNIKTGIIQTKPYITIQ